MKSLNKVFVLSAAICSLMIPFGTAQAATKKLCDQNLNYTAIAPTRSVDKKLAAFSGIWVGRTKVGSEFTPCTAFVVEQVEATGRVKVQQAWGGDSVSSGSWASRPQDSGMTKESWVGHIENGTMILIANQVSYQLTISKTNANKMEGYVVDSVYGRFPVELDRVQNFQ